MTEDDGHDLWRLRARWLGVYRVSLAGGVWRAARYRGTVLTANSAGELGRMIQADYESLSAGRST